MGTRHLICVVLDGKFKVAQYGQWDGYPDGQGKDVVDFIKNKMKLRQFKKNLRALTEITNEKRIGYWKEVGVDIVASDGMVTMDKSELFKTKYPHLSRDCGAQILELVQAGKATEVSMDLDFAQDSLFCEWAYVLDMDNKVLEVYAGFNKKPVSKKNRFYKPDAALREEYQPITLKAKYPFANVKQLLVDAKEWNQ
jgi:hypothetical protein